jgi:transposase
MFIDVIPNRSSPPAFLLRESFRQGEKTHKRTIANLSHLPRLRIEALKKALAGVFDGLSAADLRPTSGPIFGSLAALDQIASSIGLWKTLGDDRSAKLIKFLILARIAHQGSRLSSVRWAKDHAVEEILGLGSFDENDLYGAMDALAEKQEALETKLFNLYTKNAGEPPALVLYDVTSSYFEGEQNELAAFGYNRDGKKGKLQIVIGLLTAADGEPLAVEVFKGNSADPSTVEAQIRKLVDRFRVKNIVFVGDRGMVKAKGKEFLNQEAFKHITAITDPQIRKLLKHNIIQPGLFDETIAEVVDGMQRFVLRRDDLTRRREERRRADKLQRLQELIEKQNAALQTSPKSRPETALKKAQEFIRRHKIAAFTVLTLSERVIICTIDTAAKADDALLDGCYVLETNVEIDAMTKEEVDARYRDLQKVERNFRTMKTGLLEVRPIFVRKARRTKAHVFLSMLALKVVREAEKRLNAAFGTTDNDPHADILQDALLALSRLGLSVYTIRGEGFTTLPELDTRQTKIADALGIKFSLRRKNDKQPVGM